MTLQHDPMATRSVLPHWWAHHSSSTGAHKVLRLWVIADGYAPAFSASAAASKPDGAARAGDDERQKR